METRGFVLRGLYFCPRCIKKQPTAKDNSGNVEDPFPITGLGGICRSCKAEM